MTPDLGAEKPETAKLRDSYERLAAEYERIPGTPDTSGGAPPDAAPARPDLAELRQLLAKAPTRPWKRDADYFTAEVPGGRPGGEVIGDAHPSVRNLNYDKVATAALIVAAVNALPLLLDWIEAADKTLQRIRNGHGVPARAGASLDEDCLADIDALLSPSGSPEPPKP